MRSNKYKVGRLKTLCYCLGVYIVGGGTDAVLCSLQVTDKEKKCLGQAVSVLMLPYSPTTLRYVTHNDINDTDVEKVIAKLQYVIEELSHT